jgi:hypothetical protein
MTQRLGVDSAREGRPPPRGLRAFPDDRSAGGRNDARMTSPPLHVIPTPLGRWGVHRADDPRPLSEHGSATEAERQARATGAHEIVVHDRYGRVRDVHGRPR